MNTWFIVAGIAGLGLFSSNYRIAGAATWLLGFSLLQLAVAWGLMG